MKIFVLFLSVCMVTIVAVSSVSSAEHGEKLFKLHCAVCHPDGGNIINPNKTLHKKDREKNGIRKVDDIINTMRKPGPGMTPFDENTVPKNEAKEIAEYILKKFK